MSWLDRFRPRDRNRGLSYTCFTCGWTTEDSAWLALRLTSDRPLCLVCEGWGDVARGGQEP